LTLRIGLIGCGHWGRHILRDLITLSARVDVVARTESTRSQALALGATQAVDQIATLDHPLDGYVVASPTATHAAVVESLLSAGQPIFVEKPLTNDPVAARRITAAAGERVFVMDKWRYHPGVEALAAMAKAGELGDVLAIRSFRLGWGNPHPDTDAIWHLLPHDLAIVLEILGHLPAPAAAASTVRGRMATDLVCALDDGGDGPRATIEIGISHPVTRRAVVVIGSRKAAQLADSYDDHIVVADGVPDGISAAPYKRAAAGELPLLRELRAFLDYLQGGPPPRSSAAEGLLMVERIAALRRLAGIVE
jgi:predicted dehydrogenase